MDRTTLPKTTQRCTKCKKKINIVTERVCKCNLKFCSNCIFQSQHNCSYDYYNEERKKQTNGLGGGAFSKIEKI